MTDKVPFWVRKTLAEMTDSEWESLCDGCARCCLQKLQDDDTDEIYYTSVVCRYMDPDTCRCTQYEKRSELVPTCIQVKQARDEDFQWFPDTCAYRLLQEGKPLFDWHPLISGDPNSVHAAGISVRGKVISDAVVPEENWEDYLLDD